MWVFPGTIDYINYIRYNYKVSTLSYWLAQARSVWLMSLGALIVICSGCQSSGQIWTRKVQVESTVELRAETSEVNVPKWRLSPLGRNVPIGGTYIAPREARSSMSAGTPTSYTNHSKSTLQIVMPAVKSDGSGVATGVVVRTTTVPIETSTGAKWETPRYSGSINERPDPRANNIRSGKWTWPGGR